MRASAARRRVATLLAVLAGAGVVSGCMVPRPAGEGTIRYRDRVFTSVTKTADLQYGSAPSRATGAAAALRLDMHRPTGDTQTRRPALVYAHGGGFVGGDKSDSSMAQAFAARGYVAVSINYRLKTGGGCSAGGGITQECSVAAVDATYDAKAAVRWLRANATTYGVDPSRIAIAGTSAGGIIATGVGLNAEDPGTSGNPGFPSSVGAFGSFAGGLPGGLFASPGDAPGVLVHGTADGVVPYSFSADTAAALLRAGVAAFLQPIAGAGHVPSSAQPQFVEQSSFLFYNVLDLAHAAGQPALAGRAFSRQAAQLLARHPERAAAFRRWQRMRERAEAQRPRPPRAAGR